MLHLHVSHGLLQRILAVLDDVWHTVLSYGDLAAVNPLAEDTGCALVLAGLLAEGVELLLKVLDLRTLLFHLAIVLVVDGVHDLFHFELVAHLRLGAFSFASRLEDVHTPALGCYEHERSMIVRKG